MGYLHRVYKEIRSPFERDDPNMFCLTLLNYILTFLRHNLKLIIYTNILLGFLMSIKLLEYINAWHA